MPISPCGPTGRSGFGTKAELKNMNSFKHVEKALEFEIRRQRAVLEDGGEIVQETRLWDAARGVTLSMRGKEEAHDYRYFPDPDLDSCGNQSRNGSSRSAKTCLNCRKPNGNDLSASMGCRNMMPRS